MTGAGISHLCLSLSDGMSALVGSRTWIDGVNVVDAAASSIPLNDLIAHDGM